MINGEPTWAWIAVQLVVAAGVAPLGYVEALPTDRAPACREHVHLVAILVRQDGRVSEMRRVVVGLTRELRLR
ncbi:hypothetical protein [Nonomuraea rubra]|uniref:hypothetical protein n=1 Tax=Nonomuraea rubra TaxID=46180 RepID=UPI0033C9FDD8